MNNGSLEYLSVYLTMATTLFAVGISILTLTIAFTVNKRQTLEELFSKAKEGGMSLTISRKINASQKFIKKMQKVTNYAFYTTLISFVFILCCLLFHFFSYSNVFSFILLTLLLVVSLILVIKCLVVLARMYLKK